MFPSDLEVWSACETATLESFDEIVEQIRAALQHMAELKLALLVGGKNVIGLVMRKFKLGHVALESIETWVPN